MYPETIEEHNETLFPPPQPSVPQRSHLGTFSEAPSEGEFITEGLYINSMPPPMMCISKYVTCLWDYALYDDFPKRSPVERAMFTCNQLD